MCILCRVKAFYIHIRTYIHTRARVRRPHTHLLRRLEESRLGEASRPLDRSLHQFARPLNTYVIVLRIEIFNVNNRTSH